MLKYNIKNIQTHNFLLSINPKKEGKGTEKKL